MLYSNPFSRGRIARWMLEEIAVPYRAEKVEYGSEMKSAVYLAVNPMGKVPALKHGDVVVTEVAAICAYLADRFPEAGMAPDVSERGSYYRWLFFCAATLEYAVINNAYGLIVPKEEEGRVGYGNYGLTIDVLEQALTGRRFVVGDSFTAVDVLLGASVGWGLEFGTLERRPAFEAYWANLESRPAYSRAVQLDTEWTT